VGLAPVQPFPVMKGARFS